MNTILVRLVMKICVVICIGDLLRDFLFVVIRHRISFLYVNKNQDMNTILYKKCVCWG